MIVTRLAPILQTELRATPNSNTPFTIVTRGLRGEKGDQGEAGPPGDAVVAYERTAAHALGGHRAVIAVGADGADYASASDATHEGRVIGITLGAASQGAPVNVLFAGPVTESSWSWTPDESIWLADNGLLTQTPPEDGAFLQRIGFALTSTRMWVDLSDPIAF